MIPHNIKFEKEYLASIMNDWDYCHGSLVLKMTDKDKFTLELHTNQCNHNDQIVERIKESTFWEWYWQKSERGGHYYFERVD
jgi:hypothetical protein